MLTDIESHLHVIVSCGFYVLLTFYGNELLFEGALQASQATNNPQKRTMLKILHMGTTLDAVSLFISS